MVALWWHSSLTTLFLSEVLDIGSASRLLADFSIVKLSLLTASSFKFLFIVETGSS